MTLIAPKFAFFLFGLTLLASSYPAYANELHLYQDGNAVEKPIDIPQQPTSPQSKEDIPDMSDIFSQLSTKEEPSAPSSLPDPKPRPKPVPQPKPEPPQPPKAKPGEMMSIPKNAKTLDFLEGTWRCNMGDLRNSRTNAPIQCEFTFDRTGNGQSTTDEGRGRKFFAIASARLNDGALYIKTGRFSRKGTRNNYSAQSMLCRQRESHAVCSGRNEDGTEWRNVTFTKIR